MATNRVHDRLDRSQRVRSLGSLSSLHTTFTPLTPSRPRSSSISEPAFLTTPQSATPEAPHDWPFNTTYSARGFELRRDPFEGERRPRVKRADSKGVGGSKAACRVLQEDGFITRMGATASMLGGWEGERRVHAWSSGEEGSRKVDDDDEGDEYEVAHTRPSLQHARRQSSLAVFHDANEHALPLSPRSSLPSLDTSPESTHSPLPPMTPTEPPDIDTFAQAFLASQDRFGLFALVEGILEFPFASARASPTPESEYTTPALSRIGSSYALTSDGVEMEEGGGGELGKYFRARSAGDLRRKDKWEEGERREERGEKWEVRDGLGAMIDVLAGLGSFV